VYRPDLFRGLGRGGCTVYFTIAFTKSVTAPFPVLIMNGPLEFKAIVYITYVDSIESFQHSLYQPQSKLKFMLPVQVI
jgi:hypothetical protein